MKAKANLLIAIFLIKGVVLFGQSAPTDSRNLTFEEALDLTLQNNHLIKQYNNKSLQMEQELKAAKGLHLPKLSLSASYVYMPLLAKIFSLIFPYTFWLRIFLSQTMRGEPLTEIIIPFLAFLPFIILGVLAFPGIKRKLSYPKYWYRE